jgi:hypothetical protein
MRGGEGDEVGRRWWRRRCELGSRRGHGDV